MNKRKAFVSAFMILSQKGEVTALQVEDGSGYCYNYQLNGDKEWHFVDMRSNEMTLLLFNTMRLKE